MIFCIPVLFDYNDGYTVYQNELLNSLAFLEVFHPLPLVDAERFEQIKDETKNYVLRYITIEQLGLFIFKFFLINGLDYLTMHILM